MRAGRNVALASISLVVMIGALALTPAGTAAAQSMKPLLVQIINDVTNPVLVRDVDQPSRQIHRAVLSCTAAAGEGFCQEQVSIPAGKLLVIETISVTAAVPSGQQLSVTCGVGPLPPPFQYEVPLQRSISSPSLDFYNALHNVRLYAEPEEHVRLFALRDAAVQSAQIVLILSGHLVDCSTGPGCAVP